MRRTADSSFTPRQFADVMGVSKHKILALIRDGQLTAVRDGKRFRIVISEAIRYMRHIRYPVPKELSDLQPYTMNPK